MKTIGSAHYQRCISWEIFEGGNDSDEEKYDLYPTEIGTGPGIARGDEETQNKEQLKGSDKKESR